MAGSKIRFKIRNIRKVNLPVTRLSRVLLIRVVRAKEPPPS